MDVSMLPTRPGIMTQARVILHHPGREHSIGQIPASQKCGRTGRNRLSPFTQALLVCAYEELRWREPKWKSDIMFHDKGDSKL